MKPTNYEKVTKDIIADLQNGTLTWRKPWSASNTKGRITPPLRHTGEPYTGVNVLLLWDAAVQNGYASHYWMTFNQAEEYGAKVRKAERGTKVCFAMPSTKTEEEENARKRKCKKGFIKFYTVFNADQIEGLPTRYAADPKPALIGVQRIERAEAFFAATGADIRHGGSTACYNRTTDHVKMPPIEAFNSPEDYYATLAHELTHWTRHSTRLNREYGGKRFGDKGYAREELVAELGAAFLCAELDLTPQTCKGHASYIKGWLQVLNGDSRAIFDAAADAQRAVDFLRDKSCPTQKLEPIAA